MSTNNQASHGEVLSIELASLAPPISQTEELRRAEAIALPPIDGGVKAWTFVFSSFVLEALVWGFAFSFGVFQEWYLTHPPFEGASETAINAIGTVTIAIQYMEGFFIVALARKRPHWLPKMMWGALAMCSSSMFLSSFATKVWHLILLQGVVYGISAGILYAPVIVWLSEWFVQRRALAGGFIFGGSGIGGAVFPVLINYLLEHTGGFRWTARILSLIIAVCGGLALFGVKPRLPIAPVSLHRTDPLDLKFLKSPVFLAVGATSFIQGLAYFTVSLYIPAYAASLNFSRLQGTLALAVFNLASVFGQVLFGYYCDRMPYTRIMIFSGFMSSLTAFLLWGFAHNIGLLFSFVVIFGSIASGFGSVWPSASADLSATQPSSPFMFFAGCKGLAAIVGPIIAAALHPRDLDTPNPSRYPANKSGYGGYGFTAITVFVGAMMAATTIGSILSQLLRHFSSVSVNERADVANALSPRFIRWRNWQTIIQVSIGRSGS